MRIYVRHKRAVAVAFEVDIAKQIRFFYLIMHLR